MRTGYFLVVGLGKTGLSIARWLERKGQAFILYDTRPDLPNLADIQARYAAGDIFLETLPENRWPEIHTVICSPGIAHNAAVLQQARQHGIPIIGDIECLARELTAPLVAITGTNGKSTVTTLVGDMARAAGLPVAVAGNIGTPVLDLLQSDQSYALWVLELSSFQLELTRSLRPTAACLLNISPDHLDRHHDMASYIAAKQRIFQQAQALVYNAEDAATTPVNSRKDAHRSTFSLQKPTGPENWGIISQQGRCYLAQGERLWLDVEEMHCKGQHFWRNALAAAALAHQLSLPDATIKQVLREFKGLPHRTQWVRTRHGVDWINDSKGTNTGATIAAITGIGAAITGKIVLLAGGIGKGADFHGLSPAVKQFTRAVITFGQDGPDIAEALSDTVPVFAADDLDQAVQLADTQAIAGDVVLLSPACASFDMFRDFNHRGDVFHDRVMTL